MNQLFLSAEQWSRVWGDNFSRAAWQGAIAISVVWMIAFWWRAASPRVVCWAWRLVCLKLLVVLIWVQAIEIPVFPPRAVQPLNVASPEPIAIAPRARPTSIGPNLGDHLVVQAEMPSSAISVRTVLMFAWFIGVCGFVALTARECIFARRLYRSSRSTSNELLIRLCQAEADRLAIRRLPKIRLAKLDGPMLIGIWRPAILLPENSLEQFDESELRLMLAHELAHQKRRDLAWNWLPTVVGWLLFFHPLVWLMKRGWFESQEAACDELLIQQQVARPSEYGRLLVKLTTFCPRDERIGVAAAGVLGAFRNLEWRILTMAHVKPFSRRRFLFAVGAVSLIAAIATIPWQLVAQEPSADNSDKHSDKANAANDAAKGPLATDATVQDPQLIQSAQNLWQIMSTIHMYLDVAGHFPPANSGWGYDRAKGEWYRERPYLSWRVVLLPLLGQTELFNKFKLNEPWDSENNRKLIPLMPAIYRAPGSKAEVGKTNYLGVVGPNAAFPDKGTIAVPDFFDGTSKTIMLVEVPDDMAVEWTRPDEFPADAKDPMSKLVGLRKGGFLSVFADASPHFISVDTSPEMLQNLINRNDRKSYDRDDWKRWIHFVRYPALDAPAK